jgi:glycosyltransferase involved in cell wall biosynthesis
MIGTGKGERMKILVIPTTDWVRHPFPNRLNFIFDILAERHDVYVMHFNLKRFKDQEPRETRCMMVDAGWFEASDPSIYYLLNSFPHFLKIREMVGREGIDLIVSANILPAFAANFAGTPVVLDYLDHFEESASVYYPGSLLGKVIQRGVRGIVRYNVAHADHIITVTEEFKSILGAMGGKEITVVPNGVDSELLRPLSKEESKRKLGLEGNVLGYVGSLEHWVDLETVVEAMPFIDAKLLIIGPGLFTNYGEKIQRLADDLGVSNKIAFLGAVRYQDLGPYISAMDIGLNPLKRMKKNEETVGGKVFNYLACGRPVLSSRMPALVHLLPEELFYYDDVESFISQTNKILEMKIDSHKCRSVAERYDWRKIALLYERVLCRVAGEG